MGLSATGWIRVGGKRLEGVAAGGVAELIPQRRTELSRRSSRREREDRGERERERERGREKEKFRERGDL